MERDLTPDWILKDTLVVHSDALASYLKGKGVMSTPNGSNKPHDGGLTLTVLGCGTMGIAILGGILDSLSSSNDKPATSTSDQPTPQRLPSKFNCCVRSSKGADRIKKELGSYEKFADVTIYQNENLQPLQEADVVLLGCKPYMVKDILTAEGIQDALKSKLLISICAGVPEKQIQDIFGSPDHCTVVRAMPNTAAAVRESMTVINTSTPPLPTETADLISWIFTRIGRIVHLPPANMDACTALCGSGPAFVALMADGLAAGAIAMGVPRDEAYLMAAQTMRGTTGLLLQGEHPAILKDKVSTPGGCTIGGLLVLEEAATKGTVARAVREATVVASQLGQGKSGVNGTRQR